MKTHRLCQVYIVWCTPHWRMSCTLISSGMSLSVLRNIQWMCFSVSAGQTSGSSLTGQWTSCVSTTWWPVKSGLQTLSFTTARNLWLTTWPCLTNYCGLWRTALYCTPWGTPVLELSNTFIKIITQYSLNYHYLSHISIFNKKSPQNEWVNCWLDITKSGFGFKILFYSYFNKHKCLKKH